MIELKNNPAGNFFLLAGPCVIEGEEMAMRIAERVVKITETLQIPYVFKGSYRKANRSRLDSFMGIGDEKALKILQKVRDTFGVPTVTDIHSADEAEMAAEYVDILQIPAFLCRQTDLLVAAAKTGKTINIKKGSSFLLWLCSLPPTKWWKLATKRDVDRTRYDFRLPGFSSRLSWYP